MLAVILSTVFAVPEYQFGRKSRTAGVFYAKGRIEKKQAELRAKEEELAAAKARLDTLNADSIEYNNLIQQIEAANGHVTELNQKLDEFLKKRAVSDQTAIQEVKAEVQEAKQEVAAAAHDAGVPTPPEATTSSPMMDETTSSSMSSPVASSTESTVAPTATETPVVQNETVVPTVVTETTPVNVQTEDVAPTMTETAPVPVTAAS